MKLVKFVSILFVFVIGMGVFALSIHAQDATPQATPEAMANCTLNTIFQPDPTAPAAYAAVAIYTGVDESKRGEFVQKVNDGFLPILEASQDFIGYMLIDLGADGWMALRVFETEESAAASAAQAKDWVAANIADLLPNAPTKYAGRVDLSVFNVCAPPDGSMVDTMVQPDPTAPAAYAAAAIYTGVDESKRGEFVQKVNDGFLPILETSQDFIGYMLIDLGADGWMALRVFETEESAAASAAQAKDWVAANIANLLPNAPTKYAGRVDLSAMTTQMIAEATPAP